MKRGDVFIAVLGALIVFLAVTLFIGITDNRQSSPGNWSIAIDGGNVGSYKGMFVDEQGTFYTVAGSNLYAVARNGKMKWVNPVGYNSSDNATRYYLWGAQHEGGTLYAVAGPAPQYTYVTGADRVRSSLLAISDNGSLLWTALTGGDYNVELTVSGNRIYLYHDYRKLSVYDLQGRLLRNSDVFYPPVTGSDGMLYLINGSDPYDTTPSDPWRATLDAYYPNGSLYWSHDLTSIGVPGQWMTFSPPGIRSLLYNDGIVYISGYDAVIAVEESGTHKWIINSSYFTVAGFDDKGSIYLLNDDRANDSEMSIVISRDGKASAAQLENMTLANNSYISFNLIGFKNGIGYFARGNSYSQWSPEDLEKFAVKAYDLKSGKELWSFVVPPASFRTVVLNESNVGNILFSWDDLTDTQRVNWIAPWFWYESKGLPYGWHQNKTNILTNMIVSGSTVYFGYWAYSYDYPGFYNMSNCTYAGGLFAIDKGKLLWYKDTDSYITAMTERNGTVYYFVNGGKFSATGAGITAGLAAAAVYLFFRFFMLGAVARARARLDHNENRTTVLRYVVDHPGVTAADLSKSLAMNMGTIRYHLLILSLNHRLVTHREDDKYLRYFTNSGTYTTAERSLLSMVRRDSLRRILVALDEKPGITSQGLARELDISATAVNRHVSTLVEKGVVEHVPGVNHGRGYVIKNEYKELVAKAMKRLE